MVLAVLLVGLTGVGAAQQTRVHFDFESGQSCPPENLGGTTVNPYCLGSPDTTTGSDYWGFDGSDDGIEFDDIALGSDPDKYTYAVKFRTPNDVTPSNPQAIVRWESTDAKFTLNTDGRIEAHTWDGSNTNSIFKSVSPNTVYSAGVVLDDSTSPSTLKAYFDGSKVGENQLGASANSKGDAASGGYEGIAQFANGKWFAGDVFEVKTYGESLSDSEVSRLSTCMQTTCNSPPTFDSVSTTPESWTLGQSIDVSANVSDGDGSVSSVVADVYEDGTQIISDASLTQNGNGEWTITDLFTVDESEVHYNITITATDNDGVTSTYETSQLIKNLEPKINHLNPVNNSDQFTYNPEYEIRIRDDGDNVPGENITCELYSNEDLFRTVSALEDETQAERTFTGQLSEDVGSNEFKTSCVDGETTNTTTNYHTRYSRIEDIYAADPVYETENRSFELDLKTGSMVNSADFDLSYDGSVEAQKSLISNGVETLRPELHHEIPLVDQNQTQKDWRIEYDLNISDFQNQTTSVVEDQTSNQNQEVLWSYWLENADTDPSGGDYIEREDLKHNVTISKETSKAEITGTTTYSRTGETEEMSTIENSSSSTTLQGVIDTGNADSFNKSSFQTSSDIELSFNGKSRQITTGQDTINLYKIRLTDGNTGLNTAKALEFDIDYEEEGYDTEAGLTADLSVWKTGEITRRYQFQEDPAKEHSYNIYPEWAEYTIQTKPYPDQRKFDLIQYFNQDTNKVRRSYFFPTPQTISNDVTTVPLKTLNQSEASRIDFEITGSGGSPATNLYCRVDRKFGGGDFETVFMIKTGSEGRSQSFAEVNEIYYAFTCYKNGEVVETFPSQIMQNPMVLQLGETQTETQLDYNDQFDASCTYNQTQVSCEYQSQSEKLQQAVLEVERQEIVVDQTECSKTSPTATGELTCTGLNTSESQYRYTLTGEYPGSNNIIGAAGNTDQSSSTYGAAGLLLTMLIFLFTYAATSFNVPLGIGVGTLSLLFSSLAGFFILTPTMRATLIALAIIAGLVTRK